MSDSIKKEDWLKVDLVIRDWPAARKFGEHLIKRMEEFVKAVESGDKRWEHGWIASTNGLPASWLRKRTFRGSNIMMALMSGYGSPWWFTFKDIARLKGQIKEEHRKAWTPIISYRPVFKKKDGKFELDGQGNKIVVNMSCSYFMEWNYEQIDFPEDVTKRIDEKSKIKYFETDPIEKAEEVLKAFPNPPEHKISKSRNSYTPAKDLIEHMDIKRFKTAESYYTTLFHERSHSTGHKNRLNRVGITERVRFGEEPYCYEELVAESSSLIIMAFLQMEADSLLNSAAYVKGWLSRLSGDPLILAKAMAEAQKAAEYQLKPVFNLMEAFDKPEPEALVEDKKPAKKKASKKKVAAKKKTAKKASKKKVSKVPESVSA